MSFDCEERRKDEVLDLIDRTTRDRVAQTMANLEKEIAWTEHRLETLVLSKEDRDQTLDMLDDLKSELLSLRRCFPNG